MSLTISYKSIKSNKNIFNEIVVNVGIRVIERKKLSIQIYRHIVGITTKEIFQDKIELKLD